MVKKSDRLIKRKLNTIFKSINILKYRKILTSNKLSSNKLKKKFKAMIQK